jgi:putative transcriptional regulator
MKKRNLFSELMEGFDALENQRTGKGTLKTVSVSYQKPPQMTAAEVISLRQKLNVSQAVFSRFVRAEVKTIENWEQGRSKPNAQAAILLRLVDRHPELLNEIASL